MPHHDVSNFTAGTYAPFLNLVALLARIGARELYFADMNVLEKLFV